MPPASCSAYCCCPIIWSNLAWMSTIAPSIFTSWPAFLGGLARFYQLQLSWISMGNWRPLDPTVPVGSCPVSNDTSTSASTCVTYMNCALLSPNHSKSHHQSVTGSMSLKQQVWRQGIGFYVPKDLPLLGAVYRPSWQPPFHFQKAPSKIFFTP